MSAVDDVRKTEAFASVGEHFRRLHEPAFGRPHALSEPHVTSDGARALVTGAVFDELVGLPRTVICAAEDGELRLLSAACGSAKGGRFSPDGTRIAFLSDRKSPGVFQLFLLEVGRTGEAVEAPAAPGSVEFAHWSPDSAHIVLGVAGLGADAAGGDGSGVVARSATEAARGDRLPPWHPLVETAVSDDAWRSLWLYTAARGTLARLTPEGVNCWEAAWCGDDHVAVVASDDPSEDSWYAARLVLAHVPSGEVTEVLRSDVQFGLPSGSPAGTHVAVVQAVCSDRGIVAGDLTIIELASGTQTAIDIAGTDVTRLQWVDDTRLGYIGQRHLDSVAGVVDVATGRVDELLSSELSYGAGRYPDGSFTGDGRILTIQEAYHLPQQVVLTGNGKDEVLATVAHPGSDYLLSVAGTAQAVSWSAPDGLSIEGVLCLPPGEGPHPLVVNIHGGPIWAFRNTWSMSYPWVPLLVSRGYAVLSPNPRGSAGRGQAFARHVVGDMGGADTYDYLSGIDALVERGLVDPTRVGLIGGSYGGFMSAWLVTQDQRFAAAVPVSPVTDWYSQSFTSNLASWGNAFLDADPEQPGSRVHTRSPVLQASKVVTPCLNVAGANDRCTPAGQAREFHRALTAHGVESALVIYPGEGHGVRSYPEVIDFLARVTIWFERYMPAALEAVVENS